MEWILSSPLAFWSLFVSVFFFCMPLKLSLFSDLPNTDLTAPVPVLLSRPDSPTPSERECGCRWVKASSSRLLSSPSTPRPSARPTWQSWRTPWTCGESARYAAGVTFHSALHLDTQSLPDKKVKKILRLPFVISAKISFIIYFPLLLTAAGGDTHPERFWERSYKTLFTI